MKYIVSVLDYCSGAVDIFPVNVPEDEPDFNIFILDYLEKKGHRASDCEYMVQETDKFRLNVELL